MTVFVYPNLLKSGSIDCAKKACKTLLDAGAEVCAEDKYRDIFSDINGLEFLPISGCIARCGCVVVTGGDGTILRCSHEENVHGKPMIGINCGTLGFMTSLEANDTDKLKLICEGKYSISERMMLRARVIRADGETLFADALNDAVISKGEDCKIVDFEVSRSGGIVSALRADGVIFSTPTGASAYSLAAGGPIIEPDMSCIEFSQICAHSLFARTIVFSPSAQLSIRCRCKHEAHTVLTVDGSRIASVSSDDTVVIERSPLVTRIIELDSGSFFATINRKLMKPMKS